jgi:signal transduction histidine kinase/DNA-binding LacI/PurR family transcriptional regulator/CheY-like chemotaxis protein
LLGFLSSWHTYEGVAIEHSLIRGVSSAASDFSCNLLLACGVGPLASDRTGAPAWPSLEEKSACFVPVGPWNTDGLVVLPTELTSEQAAYLQLLRDRGFPIVYTGPGEKGASVVVDNAGGIRQAVEHLVGHGNCRIAFIAGIPRATGDSAQRLSAYYDALHEFSLEEDPALIAHGMHSFSGGQNAMRQILVAGKQFDAVVASNDRSAMGAISVLKELGKRVPEDVAIIGFDDIPEAKTWSPALTTLRNASFVLGYQAALRLLEQIEGRGSSGTDTVLSVPLIVRQSCGCAPFSRTRLWSGISWTDNPIQPVARLASEMTEAVMSEVLYTSRTKISNYCHGLVLAFLGSIRELAPERFMQKLAAVLDQTEEQEDDVLEWNHAISVLRTSVAGLSFQPSEVVLAEAILDTARLDIGERARREYGRSQLQKAEAADRLSLMSAQLLSALDEGQVRSVLDQHLHLLGIQRMLVMLLCPDDNDLVARSEVFYSYGFARDLTGERFHTRQFPPPGWFPLQSEVLLTLLPLSIPGRLLGYAVFDTNNLSQLAVIVRNLESALRTSLLYADAVQGRRMAEEANQMKTRFLSMVSHELRTPLNVIVGLSEILLLQKDRPLGQGLWPDLERIFSNAQHLSRLIGDVLDLVSSGTGYLRLSREPLDLAEVLRPVVATGEQMARGKGLSWSASLPAHGPYIIGDRTRLRQAVLNLVSNAVKFTSHGGVALDVTADASSVRISIHDTGIGIPLEDQPRLFTEFGQSDVSIRRGLSGMGLGLAITRELIERQDGKIGVVSAGQEGSGSTFFITLPTTISVLSACEARVDEMGRDSCVILLTNQAAAGDLLAAQLRGQGYSIEVHQYQGNPEWLFRLLASPPGAVIIDEELAANQGWDILAVLKRDTATSEIPVLVCTFDNEQAGTVMELNYQMKPLTSAQIGKVLNMHGIMGAGSTILIVDDDPGIRLYHTHLVEQQIPECRVLQAENGRVAQEILEQTLPDLVLLDLLMPEVDGFKVVEHMRQQERTRDIPVIILTGKTITEEDIIQLNRGVAAILTKGLFNRQEIVHHIEHSLKRIPALGTASQRLVRRAMAYIQAHFSEVVTRDQIAEYVSVTPDHLSDCFHQEMGITPISYLNRYRIIQARKMLEEGGQNITQVALAVGFTDSAHFSRVFQREVGTSPSAYQRSRRQ